MELEALDLGPSSVLVRYSISSTSGHGDLCQFDIIMHSSDQGFGAYVFMLHGHRVSAALEVHPRQSRTIVSKSQVPTQYSFTNQ